MNIEVLGFVNRTGGHVLDEDFLDLVNRQPVDPQLVESLGREPEGPALKAFLGGLTLVLVGLGLETCARLFW